MSEDEGQDDVSEDDQIKSPSGNYFHKYLNDVIVLSGWLFYLVMLFRSGENLDYTLVLILILSVLGTKVYDKVKG